MTFDRSQLEALIAEHGDFSGVVELRQGGEVIFSRGYGAANRADHIANTPQTRFGTASGTKTFTATAIGQLVDQGNLTFETPLRDCIEADLPGFDPAVTIHHLLSHTSGIPDYFDEEEMADEDFERLWLEYPVYTMTRPAAFLPLFQHKPTKFAPGARFSYNNAAFILLALVVEQLSGQPFQHYVEAQVFARAGMADCGFFRLDQLPERTAQGYLPAEGGGLRSNIYAIPVIGGGDGGAFITVPDMARFWDALLGHHLLTPATTARMISPQARVDDRRSYGYGLWLWAAGETVRSFYALGSDPGVDFIAQVFPQQDDLRLTLISNVSEALWPLYRALLDHLGLVWH